MLNWIQKVGFKKKNYSQHYGKYKDTISQNVQIIKINGEIKFILLHSIWDQIVQLYN